MGVRTYARSLAAATLTALDIFEIVESSFTITSRGLGTSPRAFVANRGIKALQAATRGGRASVMTVRLVVGIFTRYDVGTEAEADATHDANVEAATIALAAAGFEVEGSDSLWNHKGPSFIWTEAGVMARLELITITYEGDI